MPHRHSTCCILPPHILHSIARHGDDHQRAQALGTLSTDSTFRALRGSAAAAPLRAATQRTPGEPGVQRTIYTASHQTGLPGAIARREGDPASGDPAVDEAYAGLGSAFNFYAAVFNRSSIDDEGVTLDATVHFDHGYDNAFFDGQRMVFGDGDGSLFNRFTVAIDVIGHELTHAVTEDEAQLLYVFQPGALNEHLSDAFGSLILQHALGQTAQQASWLIGEGLLAPGVRGDALRSLRSPGSAYADPVLGRDPQPAHMRDFVHTYRDHGGVHINSGIPNHAFFLAATRIGGYAWDSVGRVWYDTLRDPRLRPNTGFARFARLTVEHAERLIGPDAKQVEGAWQSVGVRV